MDTIQQILQDILTSEQIVQLEQFCGKIIRNEKPQTLLFLGLGNNGKTVVQNLIQGMLGDDKYTNFAYDIFRNRPISSNLIHTDKRVIFVSEFEDSNINLPRLFQLQQDKFLILVSNFKLNIPSVPTIIFTQTFLSGVVPQPESSEFKVWYDHCKNLA